MTKRAALTSNSHMNGDHLGRGTWPHDDVVRGSMFGRHIQETGETAMHTAKSFLTVLFLVGSLAGATRAIASEGDSSPPPVTSYEVNVLRQVATALAAGRDAIEDLRGPAIGNSNLDRLKLATPGMDCGISRSLIFVSCHSAVFSNKKEAEAMFKRMIDYGQAALPSDSWRQVEAVPSTGLTRNISYHNWMSGARIDIDLVVYPTGEAQPLYCVRVFGWARM
jgi:hypothetical protein